MKAFRHAIAALAVALGGSNLLHAAARSPAAVAADIDASVDKLLKQNNLPASAPADDAEFLRRATLDITGRIPTAAQTRTFLEATDSDKRARLIDELLADANYGEHFGMIWYHRLVRIDDDNRLVIKDNKLREWLAEEFNKNHGWNHIVTDLLTANGALDAQPATTFLLAHVEDNRQRRDPAPNKITSAASKLFMGVRLECCECHNHPFNSMKQTDFWGVAAFFTDTHTENASQKALKADGVPSVRDGGFAAKTGRKKDGSDSAPFGGIVIPDSKGKTVKAKFLNDREAPLSGHSALRKMFASWLTSPNNKYFAQAAVNKIWANFFGRGLVSPVDDMVDLEQATHPEMLSMLSKEFSASNYDLKHLIRCICNSQTYQRTSTSLKANKEDGKLYSHISTKVMSADMLYDSLQIVLGHNVAGQAGSTKGANKGKAVGPRESFRKFFHAEADDDVGVVEDYTHGVPQVLRLMNSVQTNNTTALTAKLMKAGEPTKIIENAYITVLSRAPTDEEVKRMTAYLAAERFSSRAYNDLVWALLNSAEFLFNH